MKERYIDKVFRQSSLDLIAKVNGIVEDYEAQGFRLTVRQIYYQLVTRNWIANSEREYKRIISLCNDARLAGLMDWDMIEDRAREWIVRSRWTSGAEILNAAAQSYHQDRWENQTHRVHVVVEKNALSGVLAPVCRELDIPLLPAIGYPSVTVLRDFAKDHAHPAVGSEKHVIVLHLGDHDPSGLDMTRDLKERSRLLIGPDIFDRYVTLRRIALNREQIEERRPPENPAKTTDKRFAHYARRFGTSSWELDALAPDYLAALVRDHAQEVIDPHAWASSQQAIDETRSRLEKLAAGFLEAHP